MAKSNYVWDDDKRIEKGYGSWAVGERGGISPDLAFVNVLRVIFAWPNWSRIGSTRTHSHSEENQQDNRINFASFKPNQVFRIGLPSVSWFETFASLYSSSIVPPLPNCASFQSFATLISYFHLAMNVSTFLLSVLFCCLHRALLNFPQTSVADQHVEQ